MEPRPMNAIAPTSIGSAKPAAPAGGQWFRWARLASLATIVVSLVLLVRLLPVDRLVALLTAQLEHLGVWGPATFAAVYVLAAVLFVPGSALTLAAGAVFGLVTGTIVVSVASTTAAAVSFLIGRYLARDAVRRWAARNPRFAAIDRAIGEGGWKIIALLRLSPAVPFSFGNYLFGITSIRFWPYVLTSWLAMLPGTFMYVYLGYAGRAGLSAAAGSGSGRSPGQWALLVVGLAATVAVSVYVTRLARKAVKESTTMPESSTRAATTPSADSPRSPVLVTLLVLICAMVLAGCAAYAYATRSKIAAVFGPPPVKLGEAYQEKPGGPTFDHSVFDGLVHKYVAPGGWVDYQGLQGDAAQLDRYLASLSTAPFDELGRDEKLALLINGYNAFTLRLILDHYPLKSIKDIPTGKRWDDKRWNIGGQAWSLNQIEHEQIRPKFNEPRVHFALVCAAVGCPPLRGEAYVGSRINEQLEDQSRYVHTHDRWFRFDPKGNVVHLTSLYNWYGGDFEQVAGSVLSFAARYSPPLKTALDAGSTPRIEWLGYDWTLNGMENQR